MFLIKKNIRYPLSNDTIVVFGNLTNDFITYLHLIDQELFSWLYYLLYNRFSFCVSSHAIVHHTIQTIKCFSRKVLGSFCPGKRDVEKEQKSKSYLIIKVVKTQVQRLCFGLQFFDNKFKRIRDGIRLKQAACFYRWKYLIVSYNVV